MFWRNLTFLNQNKSLFGLIKRTMSQQEYKPPTYKRRPVTKPDPRLALFERRERFLEQEGFPIHHEYCQLEGNNSPGGTKPWTYNDDGPILNFVREMNHTSSITKQTRPKSHPALLVPVNKGSARHPNTTLRSAKVETFSRSVSS